MKQHIKIVSRIFLIGFLLVTIQVFGQSSENISGAWHAKVDDKHTLILIKDGYFTKTSYENNKFIKTMGGPYTLSGNGLEIKLEFDSEKSETVGETVKKTFSLKDKTLNLSLNKGTETELVAFKQVDNGEAPLAGVWHITDRMQDGKLVPIQRSGTRKTLKILTGDRFQWFAIDPGTKGFMGTGGGSYTFENGKYTENIEFFSRDDSRVGAKLSFDGDLKEGKWHHSGLSSKGDKIYEVWSKVK